MNLVKENKEVVGAVVGGAVCLAGVVKLIGLTNKGKAKKMASVFVNNVCAFKSGKEASDVYVKLTLIAEGAVDSKPAEVEELINKFMKLVESVRFSEN